MSLTARGQVRESISARDDFNAGRHPSLARDMRLPPLASAPHVGALHEMLLAGANPESGGTRRTRLCLLMRVSAGLRFWFAGVDRGSAGLLRGRSLP